MILTKYVYIKGHPRNIKHFKTKGYNIKVGEEIKINTKDLTNGSPTIIKCSCDNCKSVKDMEFREYLRCTNKLNDSYYCNDCKWIKVKKTCIDRYGEDNIMKTNCGKNKLSNSLIEKYGVEHYSKTDEYKEKYKKTCQDKYGVDNSFQVEEFKEKIKKTCQDKYGVDYPQQSKEILDKSIKSNIEKYGVERPLQNDKILNKLKENNLRKYGVECVYQLSYIRKLSIEKCQDKYGVDYYTQSDEFKNRIKENREQITFDKYSSIVSENMNYNILKYESNIFEIRHNLCNSNFKINRDLLYGRIFTNSKLCINCNPVNNQISSMELELIDYIKSLYKGNDIIVKDREILHGKELDIYLPSLNLAIEFNGVYWHSELYKDSNYHIDKTEMCASKNIELIHIWEDDWLYKNDIIKSIIKNRLYAINNKIYARKCEIREVNSKESRKFLSVNHIQGFAKSKYKLGLYYNNNLISLMTFGYRMTNSKREFELIRFCNLLNTNVIGGASKLFKYFIDNYIYDSIVSYADVSMFVGDLYKNLGFYYKHRTNPNYYWVVDSIRKHRFNYNKKKLVKEGYDSKLTEVEIMHQRGYYRLWSCGQDKYIFHK